MIGDAEENAKEIQLWEQVATLLRHASAGSSQKGESPPIESRVLRLFVAFYEKWEMTRDAKTAIADVKAHASGHRF
jgi:hypothetical protein